MVFLSYRKLCNRLLETHGSLSRAVTTLATVGHQGFSPWEHAGLFDIWAAKCVAAKNSVRPSVLSERSGCRVSGIGGQSDARLIVTDSSLGLAEVSAIIASPGRRECAHEHRQTNRRCF